MIKSMLTSIFKEKAQQHKLAKTHYFLSLTKAHNGCRIMKHNCSVVLHALSRQTKMFTFSGNSLYSDDSDVIVID